MEEAPATPLVCPGWHSYAVTFMSLISKPGSVGIFSSHEMSQELHWDGVSMSQTHQKDMK
jgi:hypothetical protein